ncbi:hypothetical protein FQN60_004138 [Etheostoma spectabile]|uniref:Integrase catalytic domain-containing protein n=1 Tax=Etheostoma spectabile TaxID=54343 RepID=A0A5J5CWC2_9PERO|nr:hypothetical protein FQN60_004138 [Etheostoma spectabile]
MHTDRDVVLATERYGSAESWMYFAKDRVMERRRNGSEGYPESVSDDYLQYQFWDTVQAFCSSLSSTLATQASLKGVGVGNQEATVAAATVTWLLRDGTGMLGRILFAWQKGTKLDSEAKRWRLFADSLVGVAGGATRAALTVHQARRDNMADISAKDGSQETLVNLAGLLISLILIPLVTDNLILTLSLFFLFTILHLFANYKAVRSVVMETLNEARLSIVLQQYLRDRRILSPLEANQKEPVFFEFRKTVPIKLGVRLQEVVKSPEELNLALKGNNMPYLLGVQNGCVCVCSGPEASVRDEIRAMCQAVWLSSMLSPPTSREHPTQQQQSNWEMVHESHKLMDTIFNPFLKSVEAAGWDIKRTLLDWDEWRPPDVKGSKAIPAQSQTTTPATTKRRVQNKEPRQTEEEPAGDKDPKKSNDKWRIIIDEGLMKINSFPHFFHGDYCVPRVKEPWQWLGLDVRGPLPQTLNGHKYILTVTDYYSKWVEAVPMQSCLPPDVAKQIVDIIAHFGYPLSILSRLPHDIVHKINRELKDQLKVTVTLVVYHQQTGTLDLITQQLIDRMVSDLIEEHAADWDVYLPAKVFSLCFKEHSKTKKRPFSVLCCKGREPIQAPRELNYAYSKIRECAFVVK